MAKENPVAKWLREAVGMQPGGTSEQQRNTEKRAQQINRELEKAGVPMNDTGRGKVKKEDRKQ